MALYNFLLHERRIHKECGMKCILGKSQDAESFSKIMKIGNFSSSTAILLKKCNTVMNV